MNVTTNKSYMRSVEDAKQNLEQHGISVEIPATVETHDMLNSRSEFLLRFDTKTSLEAATYRHLFNRIDVYRPLAITRTIHELYKEKPEISNALQRNADHFANAFQKIEDRFDEESLAYEAKMSKLYYDSVLIDKEVDEDVQQKVKALTNQHLLQSIEHELIHASHYQKVIDSEVELLQDDYARYFEDIEHINQELTGYKKRLQREGPSSTIEFKMAAATRFLDENRLQNIVSIAGREHKKWAKNYSWLSAPEQATHNASRTKDLLQDAILREAELQGDFEGFMQQYADRIDQGRKIPRDFTEAYAQFWSAYRRGDLEDGRENIFQSLDGYEIEGLEDTMEDLLGIYDELEGSQEERVTEIMSSQMGYLESNYDVEI